MSQSTSIKCAPYPIQSIRNPLLIIGAALFVSLFAKVRISLWFTPVPIIVQDTLLLFFGVLLGPRKGAAVSAIFLFEGLIGLPVFSGGQGGIAKFFGPTGGYLIADPLAAFIAGWVDRTSRSAFFGFSAGIAILAIFGAAHLSNFVGIKQAIQLGILPFIPGDLLKALIATKILKVIKWNLPN